MRGTEALSPDGDCGSDYTFTGEHATVWVKVGMFTVCMRQYETGGLKFEVFNSGEECSLTEPLCGLYVRGVDDND